MALAAVYARFSSDAQRDESIEIQVERCAQLIEREKWVQGEVYADYAKTGTNDRRPAFQRCVADGEAGLYDVLVVYKLDRFARNVEVSRRYKRRLRDAGVRIVSVREGESRDTPDGFLHETMDEAFAEYYSRNLSVLIRDGISKNASNHRASGVRRFGYRVDEADRFVVHEGEAAIVRGAFSRYASGQTVTQIKAWMDEQGCRTSQGNPWSRNGITKMLKNDAYIGTYRYAGEVAPGAMPAIVDEEEFLEVQHVMAERNGKKRGTVNGDYPLTGKLWCLECGTAMCGTSGKGKSGRKYRYYLCPPAGHGCSLRLPARKVEDGVIGAVKDMLADEATVEAMVASVMEYAASKPNRAEEYRQELEEALRRRDKLARSIADGIDPLAVKDEANALVQRIEELKRMVAREEFDQNQAQDEQKVRGYLKKFVNKADRDPERAQLLVDTFIDAVYIDTEKALIAFALDGGEPVTLEEARRVMQNEHPLNACSEGVRIGIVWWYRVTFMRTLYRRGTSFLLVAPLKG